VPVVTHFSGIRASYRNVAQSTTQSLDNLLRPLNAVAAAALRQVSCDMRDFCWPQLQRRQHCSGLGLQCRYQTLLFPPLQLDRKLMTCHFGTNTGLSWPVRSLLVDGLRGLTRQDGSHSPGRGFLAFAITPESGDILSSQ
jgi:hypothetical protein